MIPSQGATIRAPAGERNAKTGGAAAPDISVLSPLTLRERLRASWRSLAFAAITLVLAIPVRLSRLLPDSMGIGLRGRILRLWCGSFLRLCRARVSIEGSPPASPYFLVGNHLGYVDLMLLGSVLREPVFVSQAGVRGWPLIGRLGRDMDTIFVQRSRASDLPRVNRAVAQRLAEGRNIVLFPEGTSSGGHDILPFMAPVLAPAARSQHPVTACAIYYASPTGEPPAQLSICWWGDMRFADHAFRLLSLSRFEARLRFAAKPRRDDDRKALARSLERDVRAMFIPSGPPPDAAANSDGVEAC